MGTTISNLQILGVPEDTVRAAVPYALVGTWSERFVTVCPSLAVLARLDNFCSPIADNQNRLWVSNKSYFECYDQEPTLISRHRLAGNVRSFHFTENGDICAVTFQDRRYLLRIYRFS